MSIADIQRQLDENCKMIRQLRWLQSEYWERYEEDIRRIIRANEELLKKEPDAMKEQETNDAR